MPAQKQEGNRRIIAIAIVVIIAVSACVVLLLQTQKDTDKSATNSRSTSSQTTVQTITSQDDLVQAKQKVSETNLNFLDNTDLLQIENELL